MEPVPAVQDRPVERTVSSTCRVPESPVLTERVLTAQLGTRYHAEGHYGFNFIGSFY